MPSPKYSSNTTRSIKLVSMKSDRVAVLLKKSLTRDIVCRSGLQRGYGWSVNDIWRKAEMVIGGWSAAIQFPRGLSTDNGSRLRSARTDGWPSLKRRRRRRCQRRRRRRRRRCSCHDSNRVLIACPATRASGTPCSRPDPRISGGLFRADRLFRRCKLAISFLGS